MKKVIIFVLVLVLMVGCFSVKNISSENKHIVETSINHKCFLITYQGVVYIPITIPVKGELRMAQDSIMWLNVTNLGVEVCRTMCTRDSLWLKSPILGMDEALDYETLRERYGENITFDELQSIPFDDNAEEKISLLAKSFGFRADVKINNIMEVDSLSFPYDKRIIK